MLFIYSNRKALEKLYQKWIKENDIKDCPESVIAFLYVNDLINVKKVVSFLNKEVE